MRARNAAWICALLLLSAGLPSEAQPVARDAVWPAGWNPPLLHSAAERQGTPKSGTTATLLGLVLPGAGHIYAGEPGRGIGLFAGFALALSYAISDPKCKRPFDDVRTCELEEKNDLGVAASLIGGAAIYGFSVWDAHRAARRTNVRRGLDVAGLEIVPHLAVDRLGHTRGSIDVHVWLLPRAR